MLNHNNSITCCHGLGRTRFQNSRKNFSLVDSCKLRSEFCITLGSYLEMFCHVFILCCTHLLRCHLVVVVDCLNLN